MSKLDLTDLEEKDMIPAVISGLTDAFRSATQRFPESLLVTESQAKQFFFSNNEIMNDFKGIPIEVEKKVDERESIVKTISGLLAAMHLKRVQSVHEVYEMLENMKSKQEVKNV